MRKTYIIFQRDFRELRKTGVFLIMIILFSVITVAVSIIASITLGKTPGPILELVMSLIAYFLPLTILLAFIWAFSSLPIIKEKVNGNIASLLATTLCPKQIWWGKSLAIFIPGYILSIISTIIIFLSVNLAVIIPATGSFFFPLPLFLVGLVLNPFLFLALVLFIMLLSLANNPDIAITPSFLLGFGLMLGIPLGIGLGSINLASWSFSLWYLVGVIVVWIILLSFTRLLTKENIVMSSKGE